MRQQSRDQYGKYPSKQYKVEQYESISHYCTMRGKSEELIDEITWNDLEMEQLFQAMNHTASSTGEEYLYYLLHRPLESREELEKRNGRIHGYSQDESLRVDLMQIFKELGSTGKFSIVDYIHLLDTITHTSNMASYVLNGMILLGGIITCYKAVIGCSIIVTGVIIQMARYFKRKREIEPYFISFSYLVRLLQAAKAINKMQGEPLKEVEDEFNQCFHRLKGFERGMFLFANKLSGNLEEVILDYVKMIFHLDLIRFHQMLALVQREKHTFLHLLSLVGEIEAEIAITYYRAWLPYWCVPTFLEEGALEQEGLYFPLIQEAVPNSITASKGILLTGSNASGKSTFLRGVAVNCIMAQTIVTCAAHKVAMPLAHIYSSIAIRDNVLEADSYYLAEIKSIKRILDASRTSKVPVYCFIDEVLRGTNTVERIAASTQILKMLAGGRGICFAATHDIELTWLLKEWYDNYHFQEELQEDDIFFDYTIQSGPATSRNAIFLLKTMGYEEEIITQANEMANGFIEEGIWKQVIGRKD